VNPKEKKKGRVKEELFPSPSLYVAIFIISWLTQPLFPLGK
jgi:hypothetical protein